MRAYEVPKAFGRTQRAAKPVLYEDASSPYRYDSVKSETALGLAPAIPVVTNCDR